MGLVTQRPFDRVGDVEKGGRVRGGGQGPQQTGAFLRRQVELTGAVFGDVGGDDAGHFFPKRLDGDCEGGGKSGSAFPAFSTLRGPTTTYTAAASHRRPRRRWRPAGAPSIGRY